VEHVVLPTDTLQGICIAYKVSATHLRRANHFSGTLHSAPKKLVIPLSKQALKTGFIRVQDTDTKEYKLQYFQAEFRDITATEAKAYLELADWDLKDAVQSAKEDREWETESERGNEYVEEDEGQNPETKEKALKSGQIGIKVVDFQGGIPIFNLKGTGFLSLPKSTKNPEAEINISENDGRKEKVVVHKRLPAIATKSVSPQDLYNASPQHDAFGVELQALPKSSKK
jgi:LysM repeat protein